MNMTNEQAIALEELANKVYEVLADSSFEDAKIVLISHLQRIISYETENDFALAAQLISLINGELLLQVIKWCEIKESRENKREVLPPVSLILQQSIAR